MCVSSCVCVCVCVWGGGCVRGAVWCVCVLIQISYNGISFLSLLTH